MRAGSLVQAFGYLLIAVGFIAAPLDGPDWLVISGFAAGATVWLSGAVMQRRSGTSS